LRTEIITLIVIFSRNLTHSLEQAALYEITVKV